MRSELRFLAVPLSRRTRSLNGTPSVHSHESAGFRVRRAGPFVFVMVLTILFTAVTGTAGPAGKILFIPIDLDTLGSLGSEAFAVNVSGQVVGILAHVPSYHAFSWTPAGGMIDLGTLGGTYSAAVAVNAGGQVVGTSRTSPIYNDYHAFSWTRAGGLIDLGTSDMTIRAVTKVQPGTHSTMQNEYRRMLKQVFDEKPPAPRLAQAA